MTASDVKALRKKWKLSMREFAEVIGCNFNTVQNWEYEVNQIKGMSELLLYLLSYDENMKIALGRKK